MSKCGSLTYTLLEIKEGRDESKPQCQQGKQITIDPPEHSKTKKVISQNACNINSKVIIQGSQAQSKSLWYFPKINLVEPACKKMLLTLNTILVV